jgi:hypothetical protein
MVKAPVRAMSDRAKVDTLKGHGVESVLGAWSPLCPFPSLGRIVEKGEAWQWRPIETEG